jgi:hypothetical protein
MVVNYKRKRQKGEESEDRMKTWEWKESLAMAMNLLFLISLWNVTFTVSVQMGRGDVQAWWSFIAEV